MVLKSPPIETDGADRCKKNLFCTKHHKGNRTGFPDYCCCCNPCLYRTTEDHAVGNIHCCRCNPRLIVFKFTPTNEDPCCRSEVSVALGIVVDDSFVQYSATIAGHDVTVTLSTGAISNEEEDGEEQGEEEEDKRCLWTISIPSLSVLTEIEIDHTTVTCLGVPAIEITDVVAFETCIGSISLANFPATKVPFQLRHFPESFADEEGLTLELYPPCGECEEVPRYLCVSGARREGEGGFFEFLWDVGFEPQESEFGFIHGRWFYDPLPVGDETGPRTEYIYLLNVDNECQLWFDFESPDGLTQVDRAAEKFAPITIDFERGCACNLKQVVAGIDPQENIGLVIRAGACGCYEYLCEKCRCVPLYLCGFFFLNGTIYNNILFSWDSDLKAWVSSGGADVDGNPLTQTLTIALVKGDDGTCQFEFQFGSYEIPNQSATCGLFMSAAFSGRIDGTSDYLSLDVSTALTGECEDLLICQDATPCAENCGAHPENLTVNLHGFNGPGDEPGITGDCAVEIDMVFVQRINLTAEGTLEITCEYTGFDLQDCGDDGIWLTQLSLKEGQLTVTNTRLDAQAQNEETFTLDSESCDPYIASGLSVFAVQDCIFGCPGEQIQRMQIDIMETA